MTDAEKLKEISDWVEYWTLILENKPEFLFRSISELDSFLQGIDTIYPILQFGVPYENQLSWTCFCSYKGLIEGSSYKPEEIFKCDGTDPFLMIKKYRKEYREWVDMKIEHMINPLNSRLTDVLRQASDIEINMLEPWFSEYPSDAAIKIYSQYFNKRYVSRTNIAIGLAKMGDKKVFAWAKKQLDSAKTNKYRTIAVKCIAASPLNEADILVQEIIAGGILRDLESIAGVIATSRNINKLVRLTQIKKNVKGNEYISHCIEDALSELIEGPLRPTGLLARFLRFSPEARE